MVAGAALLVSYYAIYVKYKGLQGGSAQKAA